jgi:hypothetical protein
MGTTPNRRALAGKAWFILLVVAVAAAQVVRVLQHGPKQGYPFTWPRILGLVSFVLLAGAAVWSVLRNDRPSKTKKGVRG